MGRGPLLRLRDMGRFPLAFGVSCQLRVAVPDGFCTLRGRCRLLEPISGTEEEGIWQGGKLTSRAAEL